MKGNSFCIKSCIYLWNLVSPLQLPLLSYLPQSPVFASSSWIYQYSMLWHHPETWFRKSVITSALVGESPLAFFIALVSLSALLIVPIFSWSRSMWSQCLSIVFITLSHWIHCASLNEHLLECFLLKTSNSASIHWHHTPAPGIVLF